MSEHRENPGRGGISRRTFVKTTGALAGAAAAPFVLTSRKAFADGSELYVRCRRCDPIRPVSPACIAHPHVIASDLPSPTSS